ncbi:MAG: hypothetical protein C0601_12030 [Candidatus Muiribacterium halophilum]|uniref:Outer membrane lipoprotein BamD-like domain-containing protein n=1 Tax=Muiribacterium halophilum TaxID=2053465 RepID=A0A2N5ZAX0_MUIH1|nr:MAG: hypothetical protein C0601_12030 [Candidatus Muirbacterium halophilum]
MKRFIIVIFLISISCFNIIAQTSDLLIEDPAKKLFDEAMSYYRSKDQMRAKEDFIELINNYGTSNYARQSYFYLGKVYRSLSQEQMDKSIDLLKKAALAFSGTEVEKSALKEIADIYREAGRVDNLLNTLTRLVNTFPRSLDMMSVYMEIADLKKESKEKAEFLEKYLNNFEDAPDRDQIKKRLFVYYVDSGNITKATDIWKNIEQGLLPIESSVEFLIKKGEWDLARKYLKVLEKRDPENAKKKEELIAQKTYNLDEITRKAKEAYQDSDYDSPVVILKYVDLLALDNKKNEALNVLEDSYEDHFRNNSVFEPVYLYKTGVILSDQVKYFLDETGSRYIKDTSSIKKARERFETLIDVYEDSPLVKDALYKIITIDKDHLFMWDDLKEKAKILVDEYPDSDEAEKAQAILEKYGWN